jgi:hypothetical protein
MKKTFISAWLLLVCSFCYAQAIDSLTGPRLWLNADRSVLTDSEWADLSFFKNNAVAPSPGAMPSTYDTLNFNPSLAFDGMDDYLNIPYSLEGLAEITVLTVFQPGDTTERGLWGSENALTRNVLLTTRVAIGPDTIADAYGNLGKTTVLNSVLQNWDKATVVEGQSSMAIGSAGITKGYKPFLGSLAEIIVFNRALPFLERIQYETYLAIKYGTGLNNGNFVSSDEKLLWHVVQNSAYGKNIAGIGRDDWFSLNQKQSGSAYDSGLLIVSAGPLKGLNAENTSTINNQDFILWGDNGLSLETRPGVGEDSVLSYVERKWLVTVTGTTANEIQTELYIDANQFPADPLGYWLVIDRSGSGNFSANNLEYVFPDQVTDGKVIFKNVKWDTDGSGKDNFGFARARSLFALLRKLKDPSCTDATSGKVEVEVIKGQASYQYKLASADGKVIVDKTDSETLTVLDGLPEGDYTLTMTDNANEIITRKIMLVTPDALEIDLGADQSLSMTNPVILDVSSQIPDSVEVAYDWENSFGFTSNDSIVSASESGIYTLTVTKALDGCKFTDQVTISGADEQRVAVYPTLFSTTDKYNVSVSLPEAGPVAVKVFNMQGVMKKGLEGSSSSEYQFITQTNEAGLYLVIIQTNKGIETRKIIVY